ncbi:hypothetical protein [Bacillus spizizenii]|nr:hypothetical protein [Bacillus spizizenii]MCY7960686.1 hypothetical protein [Bacillus spizizenii]MCY8114729.1 hypothetical protein [Bacillus spizizenii]MCY8447510.1 hypothetical protein [Bacillus spizizenii]MCY9127288.1 hypothetical protein [Bacillus spizizenii]MCY9334357.1 hypothetical protein [Bacillus spizizenii]
MTKNTERSEPLNDHQVQRRPLKRMKRQKTGDKKDQSAESFGLELL